MRCWIAMGGWVGGWVGGLTPPLWPVSSMPSPARKTSSSSLISCEAGTYVPSSTHPPTHPIHPAPHSKRLVLLHPPTHPPTHPTATLPSTSTNAVVSQWKKPGILPHAPSSVCSTYTKTVRTSLLHPPTHTEPTTAHSNLFLLLHPPTYPKRPAPHSNRLLLFHPPTHP